MTERKLENSEYIELMRAGTLIDIIDAAYQKGYKKGYSEGQNDKVKEIDEFYDDEYK